MRAMGGGEVALYSRKGQRAAVLSGEQRSQGEGVGPVPSTWHEPKTVAVAPRMFEDR